MIPPSVVQEIRRLLAEGERSQRKIAKVVGVSRGSVSRIARGKRRDYPPRRRAGSASPRRATGALPELRGLGLHALPVVPLRVFVAGLKWAIARREAGPPGPVELELNEADRARYEEVRFGAARAPSVDTQPGEVW